MVCGRRTPLAELFPMCLATNQVLPIGNEAGGHGGLAGVTGSDEKVRGRAERVPACPRGSGMSGLKALLRWGSGERL